MLLALSTAPLRSHAQLRDSSRNAIHLGLLRQTYHPFTEVTGTYERALWKHQSISATLGIGDLDGIGAGSPYWELYLHSAVELREYFALRRKSTMSGLFLGINASYDRLGALYDHSFQAYLINQWVAAGPTLGYQLAFHKHFRASSALRLAFYPQDRTDYYAPDGAHIGRSTWPGSYYFYLYFRIGYTF